MILLVSLTPLLGFCQDSVIIIWHNGQTKYLLNENQALSVVELFIHDSIQNDKVIALEANKDTLEAKIEKLQEQLSAKDSIDSANEQLIAIEKERADMTKKELRRERNKAIRQWFKDSWDKIVIGAGAFGVGAAVGFGVGL